MGLIETMETQDTVNFNEVIDEELKKLAKSWTREKRIEFWKGVIQGAETLLQTKEYTKSDKIEPSWVHTSIREANKYLKRLEDEAQSH